MVKPAMLALRNKANKGTLSDPSAYGQLMIVTNPGVKSSLHARDLLTAMAGAPL